eukprot:291809-Alexandrium_andersonii.AAC.1
MQKDSQKLKEAVQGPRKAASTLHAVVAPCLSPLEGDAAAGTGEGLHARRRPSFPHALSAMILCILTFFVCR